MHNGKDKTRCIVITVTRHGRKYGLCTSKRASGWYFSFSRSCRISCTWAVKYIQVAYAKTIPSLGSPEGSSTTSALSFWGALKECWLAVMRTSSETPRAGFPPTAASTATFTCLAFLGSPYETTAIMKQKWRNPDRHCTWYMQTETRVQSVNNTGKTKHLVTHVTFSNKQPWSTRGKREY